METIRKVSEMELWEVFSQLLNQKGVSIADIANATGLPYTTVDSIIKKKLNELAVVLCNSDTATVKRVVFAGDKIILNSDNKSVFNMGFWVINVL